MKTILALDQGTTSSRALLFDEGGRVLGSAQAEFEQHFPRPGWVEHDPAAIWSTQLDTARRVLREADLGAGDVGAVGITNQRETTIVWERATGVPIHPAIVWQDRRTAEVCRRLKRDGKEDLVRARTGLLLDPYFSATKIAWMLDHVDGARARAEAGELAFGTVDSWLLWNLTEGAVHATDASNAARTLLFDTTRLDWSDELCALFGVPRAMLPEVRDSSGDFGEVTVDGLRGLTVRGVAGDQQAALFGQACFDSGQAKTTYGTGCFVLLNTGATPPTSAHGLLGTVAWRWGGRTTYALEGSVFMGGAVVQWLRDGLGLIEKASDVTALAASVPDSGGVVLVPAFVGLGAPHWDPTARGATFGLTRGTTGAHIARAALDAIAFQVADVLEAMRADTGLALEELHVDGGAAASDLLLQIQADLLGIPVVRPQVLETTGLGAAYLAGLAAGFWSDTNRIRENWRVDRRFEPQGEARSFDEQRERWREAVRRSRGWVKA